MDSEQLHSLLREFIAQDQTSKAARKSFGELAQSWLDRIVRVCPENEERHIAHLAALHPLREGELTKAKVEECFKALLKPRGPLGPATLNKVRGTGRLIILDAQGNDQWIGKCPFSLTRRQRQSKPKFPTFTVEEAERVMPHLRLDRRRQAKMVLLMGMRPGEVLGALKTQVLLDRKQFVVNRSHGRDSTKTGKVRAIPLHDDLIDDLKKQLAYLPKSPWLFPMPNGKRWRQGTRLAERLRTAMGKADLVTGYRLVCRRSGCGFRETVEARVELRCPDCNMKLTCTGIPRPFRFYDLRHSNATLLRESGADPLAIKIIQGHAVREVTDDIYTHLSDETLAGELNKFVLRDVMNP
jgi:integrase